MSEVKTRPVVLRYPTVIMTYYDITERNIFAECLQREGLLSYPVDDNLTMRDDHVNAACNTADHWGLPGKLVGMPVSATTWVWTLEED